MAGRHAASSVEADVSPARLLPSAAPHADRRTGCGTRQTAVSVPTRAERLETIVPLHRALVVADALARGNQIAAREGDHHAIAHFARQHGGVDLVQLLKAFATRRPSRAQSRAGRAPPSRSPPRRAPSDPHGFDASFSAYRISAIEQRRCRRSAVATHALSNGRPSSNR